LLPETAIYFTGRFSSRQNAISRRVSLRASSRFSGENGDRSMSKTISEERKMLSESGVPSRRPRFSGTSQQLVE
jgi:hypothetical protein